MTDFDKSSIDQMKEKIRLFAEPIDLNKLVADGFLRKEGAWYRIANQLPESVTAKISMCMTDSKGTKVKFHTPRKSHMKLAARLKIPDDI